MRLEQVAIYSVAYAEQHADVLTKPTKARGVPEAPRPYYESLFDVLSVSLCRFFRVVC